MNFSLEKNVEILSAYHVERFTQLREIVHEQSHIDFENIRQDTGQNSVWEEMASWDSELFESISKEFDLEEQSDDY